MVPEPAVPQEPSRRQQAAAARRAAAAATRRIAMVLNRGDEPTRDELEAAATAVRRERLARSGAEAAGVLLADAGLWWIWHPLGLLALGAVLVLAAHVWAP